MTPAKRGSSYHVDRIFGCQADEQDRRASVAAAATLLVVFLLLTYGLFYPWLLDVWYGDDLGNYLVQRSGQYSSSFVQSVAGHYWGKYRPVFQLAWFASVETFDKNLAGYTSVNLVLHALSALVVFVTARLLSLNSALALGVAVAFCGSRLALFQVSQAIGMLEGIACLFFLLSTFAMVMCAEKDRLSGSWWLLAWISTFLVVFTHERYFLVPVVWALAPFLIGAPTSWPSRLRICGAFLLIPALNAGIKVGVLDMPFFTSTGGEHFRLDVPKLLGQVWQAGLSVIGINTGAPIFVGGTYADLPSFSIVVALVAGLSFAWLAYCAVTTANLRSWRVPALFFGAGGAILLPAAATLAVQSRWILEPFVLLLFGLAWLAGRLPRESRAWIAALLLCFCSVCVDRLYAQNFAPMAIVNAPLAARQVKRSFIDFPLTAGDVIITTLPRDHCGWTLNNLDIFKTYLGHSPQFFCADTIKEAEQIRAGRDLPIFTWSQQHGFRQLIDAVDGQLPIRIVSVWPQVLAPSAIPGVVGMAMDRPVDPDFVVVANETVLETAQGWNSLNAVVPASMLKGGALSFRVRARRNGAVVGTNSVEVPIGP